jgi:NhaP-type Na+/H+ or K+/H+ antiporter
VHGLGRAVVDIAVGVLIGGGSGIVGGWLLQRAVNAGWASHAFRPLAVLGIALFAYAATLLASGNGFVAAFVGGLAFGSVTLDGLAESLEMTADAGALGSVVVWFLFGALLVTTLGHTSWNAFLYAVLSLTLVRMVPVALALLGASIDRATVAVVGWFGPRGLASVVFGLIAFDSLDQHDGQTVLGTVSVVVVLSVVAHGLSARPIARWYSRRMATLAPDRPEHGSVLPLPSRSFVRGRRPTSPPGPT